MIDTTIIIFKQHMFTILNHSKFTPSTERFYRKDSSDFGGRSYLSSVQNPSPQELKIGIYKPRLTVNKRINGFGNFEITLKVELSLPKLIFGNNFDELADSDFNLIISRLNERLRKMGVYVRSDYLINAPISGIHYSKNIPLTDYSTPYTYLEMMSKVNINQRLDLNQTDFRNEGHSLKYRANSFEVAFYDKLKDLDKAKVSEKRAKEKDNAIQLNLFEKIVIKKPFELLRMEVRLNKKQKLTQILRQVGVTEEPTFKNLFSKQIAQKVLLHYLDEIEIGYPLLLGYNSSDPRDFLAQFLINNPKVGFKQAIQMLGLRVLFDKVGIREFREITKRFSKTRWYQLNKEMKNLNYPHQTSPFEILRKVLEDFSPLKLTDFQERRISLE